MWAETRDKDRQQETRMAEHPTSASLKPPPQGNFSSSDTSALKISGNICHMK